MRIDDGNYPEVKIIESDNRSVRKVKKLPIIVFSISLVVLIVVVIVIFLK